MPNSSLRRRMALRLMLGAGLGHRLVATARAAPALDRPVRLLVGSVAGGGTDLTARLLADQLRGAYAPQAVVENRPGASTRLAIEAVKAAAPDGTTLLVGPVPTMTLFPYVFPKTTRYDALVDFVPITPLGRVGYGWVVRADHPARDLAGFLAWAKGKGGATFAPPVLGAPQHMMGLAVARQAGVPLTVVSYRGGAAALQDMLSGQLDSVISHMGDLSGLVAGGQIRLIAVSAPQPPWPEVATFEAQGFPGLPKDEAIGLFAPAKLPAPLVAALHAAAVAAVESPAMRDGLLRIGLAAGSLPQAEFAERIRAEREAWGPIVQASGFSADD